MEMFCLNALPITAVLLLAAVFLLAFPRYWSFRLPAGRMRALWQPCPPPPETHAPRTIHVVLSIALLFLASRLFLYGIGVLRAQSAGDLLTFFYDPRHTFAKWDAPHYLTIAQNGYAAAGDDRYLLVFFPFYPLLVRAVSGLIGDGFLSGMLLSNLFLAAGSGFLYTLAAAEHGPQTARHAVVFFLFSPISIFFSVPYSESLFFLLTVMAVYFAKKQRFLPAILLGALSAFTRLLGLLVAVPLFYEMLQAARGIPDAQARRRRTLISLAAAACVSAGFFAYLAINAVVSGNPLQFLIYERDHWGQTYGGIINSIRLTVYFLFEYPEMWYCYGAWLPQLVAIFAYLLLLFAGCRRLSPDSDAYLWSYFFCAVSPSTLFSGTRYLGAAYPVYLALGVLSRRRVTFLLLFLLELTATFACTWLFFEGHFL